MILWLNILHFRYLARPLFDEVKGHGIDYSTNAAKKNSFQVLWVFKGVKNVIFFQRREEKEGGEGFSLNSPKKNPVRREKTSKNSQIHENKQV